ncbi:MAG: hypothetical protein JNJ83_04315, partial [Verrucomicrobiaceae bacterium]|nr:hypothetical protein [Verrucomicrobiaceae bacterium]
WKAPWVREGAVVKAAANDATSWIGKIADGTVRVRFRALDVGPTNAPPLQISVRATPVAGTTKDVRYLFQFLPQKRICHLLYLEKGGGAGTEKTEYLWREKPFLPTSAGSNEFEFEIHAEGDQLSVWSGGQVIASIHDSRVSSGSCGIIANPGIDITRAETTGIGEKKSTVATLPNITNWQDVTAATRDAARTIPHIVVDQDAIRSSAQDSLTIPISPRSRRDCAVRLHHSGGGQIVMRRNDAGFLFVLCQSTQTIFSRYEKDLPKAVSIGPSRIHDAGFDYHQPHETVVVIQGTKIRAWVDGKLIGEAEDTKFTEGTTHIALLPSSVVTKVEIAELDGAALKASDSPSE